jgi:hypothetical protein
LKNEHGSAIQQFIQAETASRLGLTEGVRRYDMRLWSLHPRYLDPQGLVALWREALLARAVLRDETRGYAHHPQLERFKMHSTPRLAINAYLATIHSEATSRGYRFDRTKVGPAGRSRLFPWRPAKSATNGSTFSKNSLSAAPHSLRSGAN